jgi:hypothetical protein
VSVHRRLKLIAFPTRTGAAETARPDPRPLRFRCAPFVRDGVFDNGRATAPRNIGAAHVAFGCVNGLGLCDFVLSRLNSPPHTIAVYASPRTSPPATQHSLPSRRYPLLGRDFHPLDHISFPDALTLAFISSLGKPGASQIRGNRPSHLENSSKRHRKPKTCMGVVTVMQVPNPLCDVAPPRRR